MSAAAPGIGASARWTPRTGRHRKILNRPVGWILPRPAPRCDQQQPATPQSSPKLLICLVGAEGFEPSTRW